MATTTSVNAPRTMGDHAAETAAPSLAITPASLLVQFHLPRITATRIGAELLPTAMPDPRRDRSLDSNASDGTAGDATSDSSSSMVRKVSDRPKTPRLAKAMRKMKVTAKDKPRPVAYSTRQKQARDALAKEVQVLEAQSDLIRERAGIASMAASERIKRAEQQNRVMDETRRAQLLSLFGMRALISHHLRNQLSSPLNIPIRLGTDPLQRRMDLLSLRRAKLDTAYRFLKERFRGTNLDRRYHDSELWTSPNGDFCASSTDVLLFRDVQSVKQVYEALEFYMVNMEISISEVLGQLTLREDIDSIDTCVSNHRLMSSTDHGLVMELNIACFGEYYETYADHNGEEFGLFTTDFVEHDKLYPYRPDERVRKNITGVVSLRPLRRHPNGKLDVVLRRSGFVSVEKPQFPASDAALDDLEHNIGAWGDVMFKSMRDTLSAFN